jgi:signal transduction histidine kinase
MLERKIRLIFGLLILLIIVATLYFPWYQTEALVNEQDFVKARQLVRDAWLSLHARQFTTEYQALEDLAPAPFEKGALPARFITLGAGADQPGRQPHDTIEKGWLELFAAQPKLDSKDDRPVLKESHLYFRYAYALRARTKCIECHRKNPDAPNVQAGDLMGAIVVSFPTEDTRNTLRINRIILVAAAFITALLSMLAFHAVLRLVIVQPVQHLKKVADRVTEGDLRVRADIQTGDEFEGLSRSFNRMLQRLEASREELRRANMSLDQKLEELARANVSLFEMNQVKSKFLTTMSHELRTPLNAILGFADVVEDAPAVRDDAKLARYVRNISDSGHLLLDLINDILDLAKIEAGKMEAKLGKVSPLDLCEMTMNMVRGMVGTKDLRLELEVAADSPIMTTDASKLQQILFNLLSNAVKFTPSGFVRLTVRPIDARTMLFQVSDSGPGLTAEQQKIIFDRFSQVDSGHTRQYGGTGLGLSIVKELVDLLGGDVAVQSEPGRGATLNVTLPVVTHLRGEPADAVVTRVDPRPQPKEPADPTAPAPVTAEDTVIAAEMDADQLKPGPQGKADTE